MDRSVVRWVVGVAVCLAIRAPAGAESWPVELRVQSGPGAATTVTVRSRPELTIEDRTAGARPAVGAQGPASTGVTFTGEIALFLGGEPVTRAGAIEVADALVSVVKLFPEAGGTAMTVFVRRPVSYSVSRPSPLGEVRIELRARGRGPGPTLAGRRAPAPAAPGPDAEHEVAVDADSLSYDQATDTLTARGGVTLTRGDTTLTADEVIYDRTNGIAEARGNVVLSDPQGRVEGEFAHLDLENETGWMEQADGVLQASGYHLEADRFEKQGGPRYRITDGVFTTCECGGLGRPSWSITCRRTDVKLQGAGVARDVRFRVKDVPVLWLPGAIFPVNTERQSGFLMPRVGYSNRRGFQYEQPFYWAINKSADLTVATDVETEARLGVLGELRYALSRRARGNFTASYFNEAIRGRTLGTVEAGGLPADIPENRFGFSGHHVQPFYWKSRFYLDLFAVSDKLFLREINAFAFGGRREVALRSTRYTLSRTGLYRGWARGLASLEAAYYQDLVDQPNFDPDRLALQRLPRAEAEHAVPLLGERLVGRLAVEGVHYSRREGFDGFRGDIAPELFLPFHLGRMLNGSVTGRVRETAYHLNDREQVAYVVPDAGQLASAFQRPAPELARLDADRTRELAEVHARTGTELARVYGFPHLGLERLKHTVEPEVRYLFVPQVGRPIDETRIPCTGLPGERPGDTCNVTLFTEGYLFDERDAINRRNFFSWGFTSRVLGRAAVAPEEDAGPPPAEDEPAAESEEEPGPPLDDDTLAQGLSADAVPALIGPPAPRRRGEKATGSTRELLRASVLHGYDVSRELVRSSHASDIDLGLRATPVDWLGMAYNTTVSAEDTSVRGLSASLFAREPFWSPPPEMRSFASKSGTTSLQSPTTFGVSYRFVEKDRDVGQGGAESILLSGTQGLNEVDGSVYLRLGDYVGFTFLARYDLSTSVLPDGQNLGPHFLERDYFVRLISRCNCWVLEAGVADKFNPDERVFRVQFTLIGLGSFGRGPVNRNYVGFGTLPGFSPRRSGPASRGLY